MSTVLRSPMASNSDGLVPTDRPDVNAKRPARRRTKKVELIEVGGKTVSKTSTGKRKFHNKSKNGCDNCKRRRVKCDEGKPACQKCTNMELDCMYTSVEIRRKKEQASTDIIPSSSSSTATTNKVQKGNATTSKTKKKMGTIEFSRPTRILGSDENSTNIVNAAHSTAAGNSISTNGPTNQNSPKNIDSVLLPSLQAHSSNGSSNQLFSLAGFASTPDSTSNVTQSNNSNLKKESGDSFSLQAVPMSANNSIGINSYLSKFQFGNSNNGSTGVTPLSYTDPLSIKLGMNLKATNNIPAQTLQSLQQFDLADIINNAKNGAAQTMKVSIAEEVLGNMQKQLSKSSSNVENKLGNANGNSNNSAVGTPLLPSNPTISPSMPITPMTRAVLDGGNMIASPSAAVLASREQGPMEKYNEEYNSNNNITGNPGASSEIRQQSKGKNFALDKNDFDSNTVDTLKQSHTGILSSRGTEMANTTAESNAANVHRFSISSNSSAQQPITKIEKLIRFSQNSSLNLIDLKLFHHYCTDVWPTIVRAGISGPDIWGKDIPEMAFDYPFLMHSLLSFSATHLARTETHLEHYVSSHRIEALRLLREAVLEISEANTDALVASALILIMDSLANASSGSRPSNPNSMSPSAWIFHVKGASTILTAVWPLNPNSRFHKLISVDLSSFGDTLTKAERDNSTISELVCFDESITDLYPVEIDSPYLITLAYLDQLHRERNEPNFILRIFAFPALLDKTFLALLMTGDLNAMRIMRSYYKLLRGYTTEMMDNVWFLEGVSQVLPQDVDEYSGGGGMHMMLDFLGGGLPSMTTTNLAEFI